MALSSTLQLCIVSPLRRAQGTRWLLCSSNEYNSFFAIFFLAEETKRLEKRCKVSGEQLSGVGDTASRPTLALDAIFAPLTPAFPPPAVSVPLSTHNCTLMSSRSHWDATQHTTPTEEQEQGRNPTTGPKGKKKKKSRWIRTDVLDAADFFLAEFENKRLGVVRKCLIVSGRVVSVSQSRPCSLVEAVSHPTICRDGIRTHSFLLRISFFFSFHSLYQDALTCIEIECCGSLPW